MSEWIDPNSRIIADQTRQGSYTRSIDHLHDELTRIELLVRAQVIRWQLSGACAGSERDWGMIVVSQAEVERFLNSSYGHAGSLSHGVVEELHRWWSEAARMRVTIDEFCERYPESDLRLLRLTNLFTLSTAETDVLLLCLLGEIDDRYRRLFGYLQNDASKQLPSVELLSQILTASLPDIGAARDVFSVAGSLLANRLVVLAGDATNDETLPLRSVRIDDRIASYLLGGDDPDSRLVGTVTTTYGGAPSPLLVRPDVAALIDGLPQMLRVRLFDQNENACVLLLGTDSRLSEKVARNTSSALKQSLIEFDVAAALRRSQPWELLVDLAYREAKLRRGAIFFHGCEALFASGQDRWHWDYLETAAQMFRGLTIAAADSQSLSSGLVSDAKFWQIDLPFPDYEVRRNIWTTQLASAPEFSSDEEERIRLATDLAGAFQTTESQIEDAIAGARNLARGENSEGRLDPVKLFDACRRQAAKKLVTFAQRIEPRRNLSIDDLVLPEPNKRQLIELRNRIRFHRELFHRTGFEQTMRIGKGLLAVFTGASGTGKTMAAEALASGNGVDLYKVDLSSVVSKWIGETEKNLSRIFTEAESSNGWLFFDEGESLFGSRGDIRQAQDRMLNMEVNYLLQRIEEFSGVVILATNLRQNIDEAFLRRIACSVEFPSPSPQLRASIWKKLLPDLRHRDFDDEQLRVVAARFEVSGGNIRNIVLDAMFRACAENQNTLTLRHVAAGIAREYQKLGRPITSSEFGDPFHSWIVEDLLNPSPNRERP